MPAIAWVVVHYWGQQDMGDLPEEGWEVVAGWLMRCHLLLSSVRWFGGGTLSFSLVCGLLSHLMSFVMVVLVLLLSLFLVLIWFRVCCYLRMVSVVSFGEVFPFFFLSLPCRLCLFEMVGVLFGGQRNE